MTEKIRLKDGTEFTSVPMGINDKDKTRFIKIISELPYADILTKFTDVENISQIEYILADGSIGAVYQDCVAFKFITFVPNAQIYDNTTSDIYVVVLSTDPVEGKLNATQQYLDNAIAEITILIAMMGGIV